MIHSIQKAGGAFIIAFPIGGLIGAKYGPRIPLYLAAILQLLNASILLFLTPESNTPQHPSAKIDLREANPIRGLQRLFGNAPLLRTASTVFLLASLARSSLDAQFTCTELPKEYSVEAIGSLLAPPK